MCKTKLQKRSCWLLSHAPKSGRLRGWLLALLLLPVAAWAQDLNISGTVRDASNEPMAGVSVVVKGTTKGVTTGATGDYNIVSVPSNAALVFSLLGYATQTVDVGGRTTIDIAMSAEDKSLDEVVVVGYGTMRKSDVTGSVASVSNKQLKERPVVNALEALQGRAAGVDITNNGRPGEVGSIRIRGERSITGTSNPLYVVNGIPMMGRNDNSNSSSNAGNIAMINTNDIKSIEILKDASATAIYGSRGANGVILITTYGGETEGGFSVNYSGSLTVSSVVDSREHFNSAEWIDFKRWAAYYSSISNTDPLDDLPQANAPTLANDQSLFGADPFAWANVEKGWASGSWDGSRVGTTDWADFVIQTGIAHNHTVSVSAGTEKINAYASFGYLDQEGTTQGQSYQRYTLNSNVSIKPIKWFEMGASINGSWQDQQYGQDGTGNSNPNSSPGSLYEAAMRLYPYAVPYDDDGNRILEPGQGDQSLRTVVDEVKYSNNRRQVLDVMANIHAQIFLPVEGLSLRSEFGPGFRYRRNGIFIDPMSTIRNSATNYVSLNDQRDLSYTINNMILYNRKFGIHNVGLTLLQTASKVEEVTQNSSGENIPVPSALWNDIGNVDRTKTFSFGSSISGEQLSSYMARVNYGFNDRYLLTASIRWDGSSVLAEGHKWTSFPSVSLAWRIDQEDFMKGIEPVSSLKLRLSYGVVGNAAVDRYSTLGSIYSYNYPYGSALEQFYITNDNLTRGTSDANRSPMANLGLGWEKTSQWNVGLNFGVLDNRIIGELDVYTSTTNDLLLNTKIPTVTGYARTIANVGSTKNSGVDIMLSTVNVKASGFLWETNLTLGYQRNEIVELSAGAEDEISGLEDTRLIGQSIKIYYDYESAGIWKDEDAAEMAKFNSATDADGNPKTAHSFKVGQVRPVDQNGDYVIDANHDRVNIGSRTPTWTGAMTNTFSWKGIELMVQLYGRMGYYTNGANVIMGGKYMLRKVDYYSEDNKGAAFQRPQLTSDGGDADPFATALAYSKASFINVRTISLGYVFPQNLIRKWGKMQSLKVYAQVGNPGALYQSVDWKNMDLNSATWTREFVFGVNLGF